MLPYLIGAAVSLLGVFGALKGVEWYWSLSVFCGGPLFILGSRRRIFSVGVQRAGDEIICRYRPLSEGLTYQWAIVMPLIGAALVGAGFAPGNPGLWRFGGILILLLCPLMIFGFVRMGRRALVCVNASTLKVRGSSYAGEGAAITEIRRNLVQSIEPKRVKRWLQVEIVYQMDSANGEIKSVGLGPPGPQVSVEISSLLKALTIWKNGDDCPSTELMDQVEQALRNRSMAGL
ncbi:hypothetical protein [Mycobacterium sp. MUNTM1]